MRYFVDVGLRCALLSTVSVGSVVPAPQTEAPGGTSCPFVRARSRLRFAARGAARRGAARSPRGAGGCKAPDKGQLRGLRDKLRGPNSLRVHLHHQIGNTSTTNKSTGESLFENRSTSCNEDWFTSAGWFPVERNESVKGVNVYYRAPGNQKTIKAIPKGLQLLAHGKK